MSNPNSQEQTIYRRLAGQIQLGFYDDNERFPSVQEIARHYKVSYCPAQRALKMLENNGLVELCRGKATVVLKKPYKDYLNSGIFHKRAHRLADLTQALNLISPSICFQGLHQMKNFPVSDPLPLPGSGIHQGKYLYQLFDQILQVLGNQTILNLYYDIGAYAESAFLDILYQLYGQQETDLYLYHLSEFFLNTIRNGDASDSAAIINQMQESSRTFFQKIEQYFEDMEALEEGDAAEEFSWVAQKGRTRYCDVVAIDMICKINQGIYPVGVLLPGSEVLADIYHVSVITIRRTIHLLNKLEVVNTINGVGSQVISPGGADIPYKLKDLTLEGNMKAFLEALQLLVVTCEPVFQYSFPYFTEDILRSVEEAISITPEKKSMVAVISACMQAIVRCCPIEAIREIYKKITLLLLNGSVLRLGENGGEPVPFWSDITGALSQSLKDSDGSEFAKAFRQLSINNFITTKQTLLEIGIDGIEEIVEPYME